MEKDGGRVEKQTKAKLCNGRVGGDVHAASGGVACSNGIQIFCLRIL